jgi:hypothetical protein
MGFVPPFRAKVATELCPHIESGSHTTRHLKPTRGMKRRPQLVSFATTFHALTTVVLFASARSGGIWSKGPFPLDANCECLPHAHRSCCVNARGCEAGEWHLARHDHKTSL